MDETERETLVAIRDQLATEMTAATGVALIRLSKEWRHVVAELRAGAEPDPAPAAEQDAVTEPEREPSVDEIKRKRDARRAARAGSRRTATD